MLKDEYQVIGVMSGTSLDGLDLAYVTFIKNNKWSFKIQIAETLPYSKDWVQRLEGSSRLTFQQVKDIDNDYTLFLSKVIKSFIKQHQIKNLDAVCSHGHTVFHQPEKGITYQIGNQKLLSDTLNQTVVCNFRTQDVKLGGQGAPLVPIGDELLFSEFDYCLNLGGFSNISTRVNNQRIAYDVCPVNIVLNKYVKDLNKVFDNEGTIAKSGSIHLELLERLNDLEFYKKSPPKSLGVEWVVKEIFSLIDAYNLPTKDILRTFVEHIALMLSTEIELNKTVLVTGGGAYNLFLIERIKYFTNGKIVIPETNIIEFKEALIFGLLGVLKLRKEVNCLKSVTGATKDHSSGIIFWK